VDAAHVQNQIILDFSRIGAAEESAIEGPELEVALHVNGKHLFAVESSRALIAGEAALRLVLGQVLLQFGHRPKILLALPEEAFNGARCFRLVSSHVVLEVRHLQVNLVAEGTSVGHQFVRGQHVLPHVVGNLPQERASRNVAREQFQLGVSLLVDLQTRHGGEAFLAQVAPEARVLLVHDHVLPDVIIGRERLQFAALEKTLEHPWLRRRVQFDMHLHVVESLHASPAPLALVQRVRHVAVDVAERHRRWRALAANGRNLLLGDTLYAHAQFPWRARVAPHRGTGVKRFAARLAIGGGCGGSEMRTRSVEWLRFHAFQPQLGRARRGQPGGFILPLHICTFLSSGNCQ